MQSIGMNSLPGEHQGVVTAKIPFAPKGVRLQRTPFGTIVELDGCESSGQPGGPGLPSRVVRLGLPPFARATKVSALALETIRLTKNPELLAPMQLPQPGAQRQSRAKAERNDRTEVEIRIKPSSLRSVGQAYVEPFPTQPPVPARQELYEREIKQPRPLSRLVTTETIGPVPIAVIELTPVSLTKDGLLELASEVEVTVSYEQGTEESVVRSEGPKGAREVKSNTAFVRTVHSRSQAERLVELAKLRVINPQAVADFSPLFPSLITHVDYLVITDNHTWNESTLTPTGNCGNLVGAFERLVEWKTKRGLKCRVVTVSDIVSGTYGNFSSGARDLQETIRNFLKWAYGAWGVSWLLVGGDINVVPVRRVAGAAEGGVEVQSMDPPPENASHWTGSFLKMRVSTGISGSGLLVRPDTGLLIPYDASGTSSPTQLGWYFCTTDAFTTRSVSQTNFVRVNGPAAQVNATLQWLFANNTLPTDLYYSSLQGPSYGLPGLHDWDLLGNGIYGQHTDSSDFDGVEYETDISVGRAPVSSETQANAFVDKVIAYEQFRRADGSSLDANWPKRMLVVSSNWGGRIWIGSTGASPPGDNSYHHATGSNNSLIKLKDAPTDLKWHLIAQVTPSDVRVLPYDRNAAGGRGWYFAKSASNLSPSEITITFFGITFHVPISSQWIAVYGAAAELTPQGYILDRTDPDGSMSDQESLREQVDTELAGITDFSRLYEDEIDLIPAQTAAAPINHLTEDRLRNALNTGPHFVSLSGHGNSNGCCWLSGNMAQNLSNGFHTFIAYADSCLTNQFDVEDAVSERLLYNPNGGAVAYIGNTRFSWIGVGDNFQRAFFHRLTSNSHIGVVADTRTGMVNDWTGFYRLYNKWTIFSLNLMGDPEMPVWTDRPASMSVSFPKAVDKRVPFVVSVVHRVLFFDVPLAGATVHVQQGSFSHVITTDAAGRATFDLNAARLGDFDVTVTKIGHLPYIGKARITGPAWVAGTVRSVVHGSDSPHSSRVSLHLESAIDGDPNRSWYARDSRPDYSIILDAVTDAYVSEKSISLFIDNIDEGGTIERFAFGLVTKTFPPLSEHIPMDVAVTKASPTQIATNATGP